jgi:hypothetical protein
MLALNETLFKTFGENLIMYADDGFIFSEEELFFDDSEWESWGVKFNYKKVHEIKRDGRWIKPFKFLGLEFNGESNQLRANTRKGSTLIYDKEQLVSLVRNRELIGQKESDTRRRKQEAHQDSFNSLVNSKIYGLIQNRMYSGS